MITLCLLLFGVLTMFAAFLLDEYKARKYSNSTPVNKEIARKKGKAVSYIVIMGVFFVVLGVLLGLVSIFIALVTQNILI